MPFVEGNDFIRNFEWQKVFKTQKEKKLKRMRKDRRKSYFIFLVMKTVCATQNSDSVQHSFSVV